MPLIRVQYQQTLPLRHSVLRPHQTRQDCIYPGDESAVHFAYTCDQADDIMAILSIYPEDEQGLECQDMWRIRGVATSQEHRRKGLAGELLHAAQAHVVEHGGRYMWCNARVGALQLYLRHGYHIHGDMFELPGIGEHHRMIKRLSPA